MAKKSSLGRSLSALLGEQGVALNKREVDDNATQIEQLPVELLQSGCYQPRQYMDEVALRELAESIKQQGVIQPITARAIAQGKYEIIAGERRWRAAQLAQLATVPVILRDIPDEAALAIALIENIQREDLNALEEARALQRLINEFTLTHDQVAKTVGKSRTTVTNLLRLLNLDPKVQHLLENGDIEMGHARALLGVTAQVRLASLIIDKHLSVREAEALIRREQNSTPITTKTTDPNITKLQDHLSEFLAAKVSIQHTHNGKGKVVIHYSAVDELEGILEKIKD